MERIEFLKKLTAVAGIAAIPAKWVKNYDKFYLMQSFIAGFRYYCGPGCLNNMAPGDMLELVRETENIYDSNAIALHWNNQKIGFIPADINTVLARLMDIGALELHAEVTHIEKKAQSWENVAVAVYCLKERTALAQIPEAALQLTVVKQPRYYSIKRSAGQISRILNTGYIPLVININNLPPQAAAIRNKYEKQPAAPALNCFDTDGYRLIDDGDAETLLPMVKDLKEITNTVNQTFTELKFAV